MRHCFLLVGPAALVMDFRDLPGRQGLHLYLACGPALADRLLTAPESELFDIHQIPKRGRAGTREVWGIRETSVADVYKGLARRLRDFLVQVLPGFPHPSAHGYVPERSTLTNARSHLAAERILRADIRSFFRSITREQVIALFGLAELQPDGAEALADIVVRDGHLPLGLHTSPLIANAVCHPLDERLAALIPEGTYTRYADDLAFSGRRLPTKDEVARELDSFGFTLSEEKWRLARRGRGLYVTGLSLEDALCPRVPKRLKKRLRAELHYAERDGLDRHIGRRGYPSIQSGINKIDGSISYVRGIERELGDALRTRWLRILDAHERAVAYPAVEDSEARSVLFLLDESVVTGPGSKLLVLALVVVEDVDLVRRELAGFRSELIADPFSTSSKGMLRKRGLHWNELTPDDRSRAASLMRTLPFRAFIAFANLPAEDRDTYRSVYRELLDRLVSGRFVRYDRCRVTVLAEENPRVDQASVRTVVEDTYRRLADGDSRRPTTVSSQIAAKGSDDALPLPDLLLGVFCDFAGSSLKAQAEDKSTKKRGLGAQARTRFEQVQDKVRAVFDLRTGAVFSRRRVFIPWTTTPEPD